MLKRTSMPRSLSTRETAPATPPIPITSEQSSRTIIEDPSAIPSSPPYLRTDLRNVDQRPEKLVTFETELQKIGVAKETSVFSVPVVMESQHFTLTIELTRSRSSLRGTVRLRLEPSQLAIDLPQPHSE